MNRSGVALVTALVVVLAAGLVAATASAIAVTELRAGQAWVERGRAGRVAASSLATVMTEAQADLDTLLPGPAQPLGPDGVRAVRLGGLLFRLSVEGRYRAASELVETLVTWDPADSSLRPILDRATRRPMP